MNFVINLNKPKGITSHQAVEKVRRISGIRKAGHAGTLDPLATGVLLVCTGEATKITRFLSDLDKEYVVVMKLGEKTDTYDAEGTVIEKTEGFSLGQEDIERILPGFTGIIEQVPPMYSAVKMGGKPLYKLARKGVTVERGKRVVTVHEIRITGFSLPFLEMRVSCSKGTYIRSLCNDVGEVLGVGAHITGLERTRIGGFSVADSLTLDEVEGLIKGQRQGENPPPGLSSIDAALGQLRDLSLSENDFSRVRNGLPMRCPDDQPLSEEFIRLKDPSGKLFAIGRVTDRTIKIERMLHI
ncbi:MAG: tRNA pseudouridine(55) synthase TruB [Nitrospirae bacterium]|nr:tRNA pseudouridine(55) synthase TruB [Nitrospirota bacterium]MCL5423183.1 tRNA pseudouridine(55) synthase TruB [Nitrospirota bacterium]